MAGVIFSKGAGVNDSIFGKSQDPIKAMIEASAEAFQQQSCIDKIFVMDKTDRYAEKYTYETSLGNFSPTGEAGAYPESDFREGYSTVLEPDTWKNRFEVTAEAVEDAQWGRIKRLSSAFTLSYNRTRESFAAALLMGGTGSSIHFGAAGKARAFKTTSADNVPLFSTAHPSITGGCADQANLFADDFSYDNLCYLQAKMQDYRDDDGNLLQVSPDTIIIPNDPMMKKAVMNAIGAEGLPDTSSNSFNFQYGLWNVIVWPYLNQLYPANSQAGHRPWILMDSEWNKAMVGAVFLDRLALSVHSDVTDNDNNVWKGRARFTGGFNNWRAFAMSYLGSGGADLNA